MTLYLLLMSPEVKRPNCMADTERRYFF